MSECAFIAGAYEHPARSLPDTTIAQLQADLAIGALNDAGLSPGDVDGFLSTPDAPGLGMLSMADYLGMRRLRFTDTTETGGSAYIAHVGHAAMAIQAGLCSVVLVVMGGKTKGGGIPAGYFLAPEIPFETPFGTTITGEYALAMRRHMHEFGTKPEELAAVKSTSTIHAHHNPNAWVKEPISVDEVLDSPMVADPLHRLECCRNTDGGGALVIVSEAVARTLSTPRIAVLGHGTAIKASYGGRIDLTSTAAVQSGRDAYAMAGIGPGAVDYLGAYDSFTITLLMQLEDLAFCTKGHGGPFVASGALLAPNGEIPTNTDGGGLSNNHPGGRGGMPKLVEAVRQLRGQAAPQVQVPQCQVALVNGMGGSIGSRMGSATVILGRAD
ncbi:thiolase domain-containing protein [uncultured Jatrophihabitans sp.]|uniref:thiolase domain-containing protein n=1 Tax=uncultured Jatrophihabitans sp. TaxID=1610747 RepID=UPI0035CAA4D3